MANFIDDGYTRDGYLAGRDGVYDPIRLKYRPQLHLDRAIMLAAQGSGDAGAKSSCAAIYRTIEKHVVSWDVVDSKGVPVPIRAASVARIVPEAVEAIVNLIAGFRASDPDPDQARKEADDDPLIREILGEAGEAADAKN